jgi:hypothetical protein
VIQIRVRGEDRLQDAARNLRRAPGHLRREFTSTLRRTARPAVLAVQRAIRGAEMPGQRLPEYRTLPDGRKVRRRAFTASPSRGTRARIASKVDFAVASLGDGSRLTIRLQDLAVPANIRPLVKYLTGRSRRGTRLRHPVMGNREVWAQQHVPDVWWPTLRRHMGRINRGVADAVRTVEDAIGRGV